MRKCCWWLLALLWCCCQLFTATLAAYAEMTTNPLTQSISNDKDNININNKHNNTDCHFNSLDSNSLYCRGSRALRNIISNLSKSEKPLVIIRGLELVPSKEFAVRNLTASSMSTHSLVDNDKESFVDRISDYLRTHELNIKFSDLLANESGSEFERKSAFQGACERACSVNVFAKV